jgi:putative ABC transport system permease protein
LAQPGGFATFDAQLVAPGGVRAFEGALRAAFPGAAFRVRDAGAAAPDVKRFVDQASLFMTLLALAALLVGGIGVANGVEAWLTGRARTIATLRCLGGSARLVSTVLGMQLAVLGAPAIFLGLVVGGVTPAVVLPWLRGRLPVPAHVGVYAGPLGLAAGFGVLVGVLFALGPLRRAAALSGAGLFRLAGLPARIRSSWRASAVQVGLVGGLAGLAALSVPDPWLALGFCGGTVATLLLLRGVAAGLMRVLPLLPAPRDAALAFGLRRLYGPASSLPLMLLSAGVGLTVLVAVAEIRGNLVAEFTAALPAAAPSFYFIDIQPGDWPVFQAALAGTGAYDVRSRPAMRARILAVGGVKVERFHPPEDSAWPLRSDIGFSFAAAPPPGTKLAAGDWWAADYLGAPEVSFDARIAREWGVGVGDRLTVAVLGRVFDLRIANLREIDWQNLQMNFLMVGTPDPFAAAPHTLIATLRAPPGREGDVLAAVTDALPGVTGIDVGQVLRAVGRLLGEVGTAVSAAGLVALLAGGLVLVSAVAAEREVRIAEAVVLKTLGASRAQIRRAWLFEFAIAGGIAGLVAAALGTLAAAVTVERIFHSLWRFEPGVCAGTVVLSVALMMALGFAATNRALREPAAARLRLEAGG